MGRAMIVVAAVVVGGVLAAFTAAAQPAGPAPAGEKTKVTIALLPLAADERLALYGQPVADELSRALAAEGLDVAVVGFGDPVPTRATLVVDGKLVKRGKKKVLVSVRLRDPNRAETLATVEELADSLTAIDRAAATVAGKLVPEVRTQLAARAQPVVVPDGSGAGDGSSAGDGGAGDGSADRAPIEATPAAPPLLLVASSRVGLDGRPDAMVAAIAPAFERLIAGVHHRAVATGALVGESAEARAAAVRGAGARFAILLEVLALDVAGDRVPTARARARVRIVDAGGAAVFDRVVRTDTLVGAKGDPPARMAAYAGDQLAEVVRRRLVLAVGSGP